MRAQSPADAAWCRSSRCRVGGFALSVARPPLGWARVAPLAAVRAAGGRLRPRAAEPPAVCRGPAEVAELIELNEPFAPASSDAANDASSARRSAFSSFHLSRSFACCSSSRLLRSRSRLTPISSSSRRIFTACCLATVAARFSRFTAALASFRRSAFFCSSAAISCTSSLARCASASDTPAAPPPPPRFARSMSRDLAIM